MSFGGSISVSPLMGVILKIAVFMGENRDIHLNILPLSQQTSDESQRTSSRTVMAERKLMTDHRHIFEFEVRKSIMEVTCLFCSAP